MAIHYCKGYTEINIKTPETGDTQTALLLVVPSTENHQKTPVLLGKNVIHHCLATLKEGSEYAHTHKTLSAGWEIAHRCITACDQHIRKGSGEVGMIKSLHQHTVALQSNQTLTLEGKTKIAYCQHQVAMICPTKKSILPDGVEIAPVVNLK